MTSVSADLRCLAAWTEAASRWLEASARGPNDDADPMVRTVAFDAASLDDLITALRGVPGILEALANQVQERPALSVIQGGRR
jgi:hypothetical protein